MFNELAEKRRSIKVFSERPVETEKLVPSSNRPPVPYGRRARHNRDELRFDKVSYNRYGQKKP